MKSITFESRIVSVLVVSWLASGLAFADKPAPQSVPVTWNARQIHDLDFAVEDSVYVMKTTGDDPFLTFEIPSADRIDRDWYLSMETFCTSGMKNMHFYTGKHPQPADMGSLPDIDSSEGWTTYHINLTQLAPDALNPSGPTPVRIDFGTRAGVRFNVRNVRLRQATDRERDRLHSESRVRRKKKDLDRRIAQYYKASKPVSIDRVEHQDESIIVCGSVTAGFANQSLWIVPRRANEVSALPVANPNEIRKFPVEVEEGRFEAQVPAGPNAPLRYPGVRFQIMHQTADRVDMVSAARYPNQLDSRDRSSLRPPPVMRAAKGLTCLDVRFTADHMQNLGLQHGNLNIVMSGLIRKSPSPGFEPITLRGRPVFYNRQRVRAIDRNVQRLREAKLTVAAILLIPCREGSRDPIVHPDADPAGVYAMPNLATAEGADLYSLTCDLLADRYSQSDERHGRIDHWIVHNEVDAGWSWTNMGEQPINVFLDHYFRSMRIVDAAIRTRNPHATAFISLTHMWNQGQVKPWRWYPAKDVMDALITHSRTEGDFPWGLAFHPYPESLWEADTWNDDVGETIDTEKITIKNLHVLDHFMHTEAARRSDGSVRTVILSEQGFHAPMEKPEGLEVQAAALLYTFEKIRKCPSIVAFDYHRPVDHPKEGGLRLGLRGLSSREHPIGRAKPAWDVYRAIGTEEEAALVERYRGFWSEE